MTPHTASIGRGIDIAGPDTPSMEHVLSPEATDFIADLQREFGPRRKQLLQLRKERQRALNAGEMPKFLNETRHVRDADWTVAPIPPDIRDRRVEITGPTDRKMVINALNSGAKVFMADFEDANSPTWSNMIEGQQSMFDAVRRTIEYTSPEGKAYHLKDEPAVLMVRPRGWHLPERHFVVDGEPMSGSIFDFGLYFFHNARELLERGSGPYFYLPKLENHHEAQLWNDIFVAAQDKLGIPQGSIRATVLIENILAVFEADEILHALRDHSAGLNCGRWDYIFSFIKKFQARPEYVLPDRSQITMTVPFMRAYCKYVIHCCHRRGAHAMGGMAAQIPIKSDLEANAIALEKVRDDKEREVEDGHDGTWVAHPGLVHTAMAIFDRSMKSPNQIDKQVPADVTPEQLLAVPKGTITEEGLRVNINVGVAYLEAWLRGNGCVPLYNLMEDAATSEISRSQIWQWIRHQAALTDGRTVTKDLFRQLMSEELDRIRDTIGTDAFRAGRFKLARDIFEEITTADELVEFLTLPAYEHID